MSASALRYEPVHDRNCALKEKIIAFADMYNAGPANAPQNTTFHLATQIMLDNLKRMNVDFERVVSVHAPNPDRPINRAEIENFNPR